MNILTDGVAHYVRACGLAWLAESSVVDGTHSELIFPTLGKITHDVVSILHDGLGGFHPVVAIGAAVCQSTVLHFVTCRGAWIGYITISRGAGKIGYFRSLIRWKMIVTVLKNYKIIHE